jgi:pyruvate kinase
MYMRKTKIICTLGPATDSDDIVRKLMQLGMNVARLNFSHGSYEEHQLRIDRVKRVREELNLPVALLLDTKGPEIRTGTFSDGSATLIEGETIVIRGDDIVGSSKEFSVSYKGLPDDVRPDARILIDDGLIELVVLEVKERDIYCRIENGGQVSNKKSINVPGTELHLPSLTFKDTDDILFAIRNEFDFIAASFVRKPRDVQEIRHILEKHNAQAIHIIAKIENSEGVSNFEDILKVSDGIMVARGDLGVEIPAAEVPIVQKRFIRQCHTAGKISITATQMLDSMIRNPRPTRAEVSDVANAIFDGTSAVMLSGETAAGKYPFESLQMMDDIARQTEGSIDYWKNMQNTRHTMISSVANAISHATCTTAMDLNAKAIITITHAGRTARLVSRFRPACPIVASTVFPVIQRQLNLSWGVCPILVEEVQTTDEMFDVGIRAARDCGFLFDGDIIVMTGGTPVGMSGTTNTIKVQAIGNSLVHGIGQKASEDSPVIVSGTVMIIRDPEHISPEQLDIGSLSQGDDMILVAPYTNNTMMPLIRKAKALVVEDDDPLSHTATVAIALEIPAVLSCENATRLLKDGLTVTVDAGRGVVS